MKAAVIAFTDTSGKIAKLLTEKIGAAGYVISKRHIRGFSDFNSLTALMKDIFGQYDALVFVGACGIAVRAIAPYVKSKVTDPAVVVIDEKGSFVIPILSGHIGGANELAVEISQITGGTPVITTATDINNKFSVDTFAVKNNLHIGDTKLIKEISSRVIAGEKIGLYTDYEVKNIPDCFSEKAEAGICISNDEKKPFKITLNLFPKNIVVGIGCRRNCENIEEHIIDFLKTNNCSINSLCAAATIDVKKNEQGILDFCGKYKIPMNVFSAAELNDTEGEFKNSDFVKKTVGVGNVCERAAAAARASIMVHKTVFKGMTLALGKRDTKIDFSRGF